MKKFKQYEVLFRTWNVRSYVVVADDYDEAVKIAESTMLPDLSYGEEYETMDIIESKLERTEEE